MSDKTNKNKAEAKTNATTPPSKLKMKNTSITIKKNQAQKKKMNQLSTHILDTDYETNTNTIIKYYKEFDYKRIDSLLEEAYDNLNFSEKEGLDFFEDDSQFIYYVLWLVSVRFTSLSRDVPTTLPEQIPIMLDMNSTGLFSRIHNDVLDPAEVAKVTDKLNEFQMLMEKIGELAIGMGEEIDSKVINKEVLKMATINKGEVIHPLVKPHG